MCDKKWKECPNPFFLDKVSEAIFDQISVRGCVALLHCRSLMVFFLSAIALEINWKHLQQILKLLLQTCGLHD